MDAIEESPAAFKKKQFEINPQYSDSYYNMGVAYAKKDQLDGAIKSLQKAFEDSTQRMISHTFRFGCNLSS